VKPVALVTGEVSPYRREPFRLLAEAEDVEVLPFRELGERAVARRVRKGGHRAVIAGLGGRVALPATYLAARRAGIPFVLWASLWAHPRTPAHALSYLPTVYLYSRADAVVTYGPHVSEYVARHRRGGNIFVAPQASVLDAAPPPAPKPHHDFKLLFAGRLEREKGFDVLLDAWRRADVTGELLVAGGGPIKPSGPGVRTLGFVPREELPALYTSVDALVLPSIRTATFLEPWGLVVNEAMQHGKPVIASDAVGAVAGGLVEDGRNGLVTPAGDAEALATRIRMLAMNPELRERLGAAARADVADYGNDAWVEGMRRALRAVGVGAPC
jgi:glycosyltransferase involved in cell wall biosynthesis